MLNEQVGGKKMPFKSQAQQKWAFANKPEMAKRWAKETPNMSSLPKKKSKPDEGPAEEAMDKSEGMKEDMMDMSPKKKAGGSKKIGPWMNLAKASKGMK